MLTKKRENSSVRQESDQGKSLSRLASFLKRRGANFEFLKQNAKEIVKSTSCKLGDGIAKVKMQQAILFPYLQKFCVDSTSFQKISDGSTF